MFLIRFNSFEALIMQGVFLEIHFFYSPVYGSHTVGIPFNRVLFLLLVFPTFFYKDILSPYRSLLVIHFPYFAANRWIFSKCCHSLSSLLLAIFSYRIKFAFSKRLFYCLLVSFFSFSPISIGKDSSSPEVPCRLLRASIHIRYDMFELYHTFQLSADAHQSFGLFTFKLESLSKLMKLSWLRTFALSQLDGIALFHYRVSVATFRFHHQTLDAILNHSTCQE